MKAALFPLTKKEEVQAIAAQYLLDQCAKTKSVILTDEGQVLPASPTRKKTVAVLQPDWIHPVTNLNEANSVLAMSYEIRNGTR